MAIPSSATSIAFGSDISVWAFDQNSNTPFKRNPDTLEFEPIDTGIFTITSLDVAYDGTAVALGKDGKLLIWDQQDKAFKPHQKGNVSFDSVYIGDAETWALKGSTAYYYDPQTETFLATRADIEFETLTVAKVDDTVYGVDKNKMLWRFDYSSLDFEPIGDAPIPVDMVQLTATTSANLWAVSAEGEVFQFNTSDDSNDGNSVDQSFISKSQELGLAQEKVSSLAVTEEGIVIATTATGTEIVDSNPVAIKADPDQQYYDVAIATDTFGRMHMAYSTDGGIFHAIYSNGGWVLAQAIPGSGQGTEVTIDFDAAGNVFIGWIEGLANQAEVYLAKGATTEDRAAYVFGAPMPVTNDLAEDHTLDVHVSADGMVTLTTHKQEAYNWNDDNDTYSYSLNGKSANFKLLRRDTSVDNSGTVLEIDSSDVFLHNGDGLEMKTTVVQVNPGFPGFGYVFKFEGDALSVRLYGRYRYERDFGNPDKISADVYNFDSEFRGSIDFKKILKDSLGETGALNKLAGLSFSIFLDPYEQNKIFDDGSTQSSVGASLGMELNIAADLAAIFPALEFIENALKVFGAKTTFGVYFGLGMATSGNTTFTSDDETDPFASPQLLTLAPITFVDTANNDAPITPNNVNGVAPQDVAGQFVLADLSQWAVDTMLAPFQTFTVEGEDLARTIDAVEHSSNDKLNISGGIFGQAKEENAIPILGKAELKAKLGLTWDIVFGQPKNKFGARTTIEAKFGKHYWKLLDFFIGGKNASEDVFTAYGLEFSEYIFGGLSTVHDAEALAFGGTENGSDVLYNSNFNYVMVGDTAYGVYIEEVEAVDENEQNSTLDLIKVIEGLRDPETGEIIWREDTIHTFDETAGLNANPIIAAREANNELLLVWSNTPDDNAAVEGLNTTPAGKTYLLYGASITPNGVAVALNDIPQSGTGSGAGVYFSNLQYMSSIGAAVAAIGDINGQGNPDLGFGAPDAASEAGRVYILFGESIDQVADIDALDGTFGFTFQGDTGDEVGLAITAVGHFDDDAFVDFAISAPGANNQAGVVYVIYGGQDFTANGGAFTSDDIAANILGGLVIDGPEDGNRFGASLSGGYDLTGDGDTDLAIGSIIDGTITIVDNTSSRIIIDINPDAAPDPYGDYTGSTDIGGSIAMLEDANRDGAPDLLIGSSSGEAILLFGGKEFAEHADAYVVMFDISDAFKTVITFTGSDQNGDGIISTAFDEVDTLQLSVYENRERVAQSNALDPNLHQFSYDTSTERVLSNAGAGNTLPAEGLYGLSVTAVGRASASEWLLATDGTNDEVVLSATGEDSGVKASSEGLGNNFFSTVSKPDYVDLDAVYLIPGLGITLSANTSMPLRVHAAGNVNGDKDAKGNDIQDFIVGYDQYSDDDGTLFSGRSYVVYGSSDLNDVGSVLELDDLTSAQGFVIEEAGGRVTNAGDVNGDGYGDLLVSSPYADGEGGAQDAGASYVIFGGPNGQQYQTFDITNTSEMEAAGVSVAGLGDLDGDGKSEILIGAPHQVDRADYTAAQEQADLYYSTRSLNLNAAWSDPQELLATDDADSVFPVALQDTDLGTLAVWIDYIEDEATGQATAYVQGAFYTSAGWSDTMQIGSSRLTIAEATIAEFSDPNGKESVPTVVWIETDEEQSSTTKLYQTFYEPGTGTWTPVEAVEPVTTESPALEPTNNDAVLVDGQDLISVVGTDVRERDGTAVVTIVRQGDLSKESGPYQYRFFDFSAVYEADYRVEGGFEGAFTFKPGQDVYEIPVEIIADDLYEGHTPEELRIEVWSEEPEVYVSKLGLASHQIRLTATVSIEDEVEFTSVEDGLQSFQTRTIDLGSIDSGFQLNGNPDVNLGLAVSQAGFVNGDAIGDFMTAAPNGGAGNRGEVYLLFGAENVALSDQDLLLEDLDGSNGMILKGSVGNGLAGMSVAGVPLTHDIATGATTQTPIAVGAPGTGDDPGRVYVIAPKYLQTGNAELELSGNNVLEIVPDANDGISQFGNQIYLQPNGAVYDLIVVSAEQVHLIHDIFAKGDIGTVSLSEFKATDNLTTITNGAGTGFGSAIALLDFDGDKFYDLALGSPDANPLINDADQAEGTGGMVTVLRGSAEGFAAEIDVADLEEGQGFRLLGQTAYTPGNVQPAGDGENGGAVAEDFRADAALFDAAGTALTSADLNGDGNDDLIIGAPQASLVDPGGHYTFNGVNKGRVYVLFGGNVGETEWSDPVGDYELISLYGDNHGDGVVLEGTKTSGFAGSALSTVRDFRGQGATNLAFEDIVIGAHGVDAGAGEAYVVFGSKTNFSGHNEGENVFQLKPGFSASEQSALSLFTLTGSSATLDLSNTNNEGSVGYSVAGVGNITADSYGSTEGDDVVLGAPSSQSDGYAKTYVATGHPWIKAGESLSVDELRSDNGFVEQMYGRVIGSGDFDNNGFSDFVTIATAVGQVPGSFELILTKGASNYDIQTATNRDVRLQTEGGLLSRDSVAIGDFDGDGISEVIATLQSTSAGLPFEMYHYDLSNLDVGAIKPTLMSQEQIIYERGNAETTNWYTADLNGDGYDDLIREDLFGFSQEFSAYNVQNRYYLNTADGSVSFRQVEREESFVWRAGLVASIGDLYAKGSDVIKVNYKNPHNGVARFFVGEYQNGQFVRIADFSLGSVFPDSFNRGLSSNTFAVFGPGQTGDLNGDGYEDLPISILTNYDSRDIGKNPATAVLFGGTDYSNLDGVFYSYEDTINMIVNPERPGDFRFQQASIMEDFDANGTSDLVAGGPSWTSYPSFVAPGGTTLPEHVPLYFFEESLFRIFSINTQDDVGQLVNPNKVNTVSNGGDLNGDGLGDFVISDRNDNVQLTYGVYGSESKTKPQVKFINGTPDDDYIVQSDYALEPDVNEVRILAKEGDDYIVTQAGFKAMIYGGEGDDTFSVGSVDQADVVRYDGGTGWNTLVFDDPDLGISGDVLDLEAGPAKFQNLQLIDLGPGNRVDFNIYAIQFLAGSGHVVLLKGDTTNPSQAFVNERDWWIEVGEDTYGGEIYTIYQYLLADGAPTLFHVWAQKDGIEWIQPDQEHRGSRDNDIFVGRSGDDSYLLRWGTDVATGSEGADEFKIDSRYLAAGDSHTITDFNPAEGDRILLRNFDRRREIASEEDLKQYIEDGYASITPGDDADTLSVTFSNLDENFGSDNQTFLGGRSDDVFDGGAGDDKFVLRWGDDTATGGADADVFILDARYIGKESVHVVRDLNFDQGDTLKLRFFTDTKVEITNQAQLLSLNAEDFAKVARDGEHSTLSLWDDAGELMEVELSHATWT